MNLSIKQKQTHTYREHTSGCQGGGGWERDGLGVWGLSDTNLYTDVR